MTGSKTRYAPFLLIMLLTRCDIQPISVGSWRTQLLLPESSISSTWVIEADETLAISGGLNLTVDSIQLDGSRIAFTSQLPLSDQQLIEANFSGTVSGNSLQGTFFTTAGNFTLSGERQ